MPSNRNVDQVQQAPAEPVPPRNQTTFQAMSGVEVTRKAALFIPGSDIVLKWSTDGRTVKEKLLKVQDFDDPATHPNVGRFAVGDGRSRACTGGVLFVSVSLLYLSFAFCCCLQFVCAAERQMTGNYNAHDTPTPHHTTTHTTPQDQLATARWRSRSWAIEAASAVE